MNEEIVLKGGMLNPDIVRIGDTVHRVPGPNAEFVRKLLAYLANANFSAAPKFLGIDDKGREILTYFDGRVYPGSGYKLNDKQLQNVAKLIRDYHDLTAKSDLTAGAEIVAHGELGPHNTVYVGSEPVGIIDWDDAAPGTRLRDFAYAVDCYVDLISTEPPAQEQARRVRLMCEAYGWDDIGGLLEDIRLDYRRALENHIKKGNRAAIKLFTEYADHMDTRTTEVKEILKQR